MAKQYIDAQLFKHDIPKSSKFLKGDWILKWYGKKHGLIAQIIGYRRGYYSGVYLIEFEDGSRIEAKPKYFRGPYKTKEIAIKFAENPNFSERQEDLRLKATDIRSEYKTLPKLEKTLKETYTKEPYNFKWLDTPLTIKSVDRKAEILTVLAIRKDSDVVFENNFQNAALKRNGIDQFCIVRFNDPLTKKLITKKYSPYQISYPELTNNYSTKKWDFGQDARSQVSIIFKIKSDSYFNISKENVNFESKFRSYNRLINSNNPNAKDLVEISGNLKIRNGKKHLSYVSFDKLSISDYSVIKDYHVDYPFAFDDDSAKNLNCCPLSTPVLVIGGNNLQSLSTNNHTEVEKIHLLRAPLLKNLKGLETFKNVKVLEIGSRYITADARSDWSLESLEGCPGSVDLTVSVPSLRNLKGLPSVLQNLTVNVFLEQFDCNHTKIAGTLIVLVKPKTLVGLPSASKYHIPGYTNEEIQNELQFRSLRDKLPEIDGIF